MRRFLILVSFAALTLGGCKWMESRPKDKPYPNDPPDEIDRRGFQQMQSVAPPDDWYYGAYRH